MGLASSTNTNLSPPHCFPTPVSCTTPFFTSFSDLNTPMDAFSVFPPQRAYDPDMLLDQSLFKPLGNLFSPFDFPVQENDPHYGTGGGSTFDACTCTNVCSTAGSASGSFSSNCIAQPPAVTYRKVEGQIWKSLPDVSNPDQLGCIDPRLTVGSRAVHDPRSRAAQLPSLESDLYDEDGEFVGKLLPDDFRLPRHRVSVDIPGLSFKTFAPCFTTRGVSRLTDSSIRKSRPARQKRRLKTQREHGRGLGNNALR